MPTFNEGQHPCSAILSEANFHRSRDIVTVASGQGKLPAGTVLAKAANVTTYTMVAAETVATACAVLLYPVDATSADATATAAVRDAELRSGNLIYGADVNTDALKASVATALATKGLIVR